MAIRHAIAGAGANGAMMMVAALALRCDRAGDEKTQQFAADACKIPETGTSSSGPSPDLPPGVEA
ncbi:hypothetical protein [Rugamonas sp.]|uniref:hypothetical protein n=1 Tax=Rugamonas sp. TaxID=1926287 RepID=UPI0025E0D1BA|nr:hypothetical protein [Rugamonas sp.]